MIKQIIGPEEHTLALPYDTAIALEKYLNKPFGVLYAEIMYAKASLHDLNAIILHALIGGGMSDSEAFQICENYVRTRPALSNLTLCADLLEMVWSGQPLRGDDDDDDDDEQDALNDALEQVAP